MRVGRSIVGLLVLLALLGGALPSSAAAAPGALLAEAGGGLRLRWAEPQPIGWAEQPIDGLQLDIAVLSASAAPGQPVQIRDLRVGSEPYRGALRAAPAPLPQSLDGEARPGLAQPAGGRLPRAPLWVMRDAQAGGRRTLVLAISRLFDAGDGPRRLTALDATIAGATLSPPPASPARAGAPAAPGPTNPVVGTALARLSVAAEGLQRITGADLAAAGVATSGLSPARLRVLRRGVEVAAEVVGGGDGSFDSGDELRFYAAPPGDRWSAADIYWLAHGPADGLRMQSRSVLPAASAPPTAAAALERGTWREARLYDTTSPGPLGDYWYSRDMRIDPSSAASAITVTLQLTPTLPIASGAMTLTLRGVALTTAARQLRVSAGGSAQTIGGSGAGSWSQSASVSAAGTAAVALLRSAAPHWIEIQAIDYLRPVTLSVGGQGARFEGWPSLRRYQVSGADSARALYDVSDPLAPQRLGIPAGASFSFDDQGGRSYLLSGPGMLPTPQIARYTPVDLAAPRSADAIYIAPAAFHSALAPLVALRQSQGYQPLVVDVQAIYDAWGDGQISPDAIRSFLRYARGAWPLTIRGVTLVGDGTADPRNYARRNNITWVPPYLAHVDPWLGETACEACYAQLDGAGPLDDSMPDLPLGRLPVKSAGELGALVSKIVAYETAASDLAWMSRVVLIADNYREASGAADPAGDFAAQSDAIAARAPASVAVRRLYYDPSPTRPPDGWREPGALAARQRTMQLISDGAALVSYVGHSSQFQWAVTDPQVDPSSLLGLFDADLLTNVGRPAVVRSLTCLTAAFQTPAFSGTTLDERLLLQPGGAVAVWGPTGLGVATGHDALVRGFDEALWASAGQRPAVGALALAGLAELHDSAPAYQYTVWTYALLGDPLTGVRVIVPQRVLLPLIRRS